MANGKYRLRANKKNIRHGAWLSVFKICFIVILCSLASCTANNSEEKKQPVLPTSDILQEGDMILRLGNSWISKIFMNYSRLEKLYSHVGIVTLRHDSVFVIHSEANEYTGIGGMMEENLASFLSTSKAWAVYRFDTIPEVRNHISQKAKEYLRQETPFDTDFDLNDDSKIYCTELVANSTNYAYQREIIKPSLQKRNRTFFRIDDCYLIPQSFKICSSSSFPN